MSSGLDSKRPRLAEPSPPSPWPLDTPHSHPHRGVPLPQPTPAPRPLAAPPGPHSLPPTSQHAAPSPGPYQPNYPPTSEPHGRPPPHSVPPLRPPPHREHSDGRRHHDQEPYAAMQDYRPPPSPAHAHPPSHPASLPGPPGHAGPPGPPASFRGSYPSRDPAIKRDPGGEDLMSQPRRSHSAGGMADGLPGPATPMVSGPHQPSGSSQPYHDDGRRHMSFDAGPPPNIAQTPGYRPPGYATPTQAPQTPISHQQPYEPMAFQSGDGYYNVYTTSVAKRKATRASQACENCRSLKAKCDEQKPCKNCKEKNLECKFRDPVPKIGDRVQTEILEGVQSLHALMKDMQRMVQSNHQRLSKVEAELHIKGVKEEDVAMEDDAKLAQPLTHSPQATSHDEPLHISPPSYTMEDELEANPGQPIAPGAPAIPHGHTTGAGHLLSWPAINELVGHHLQRNNVKHTSEFPIRQEEARGILRLYGRGEGRDMGSPERDGFTDHDALEHDDTAYSDGSTPSPAGDSTWGHVGGFSPVNPADYTSTNPKQLAVLTVNATPDYSEGKVWKLVASFEDNILNMHPIISKAELHGMVKTFLESIPKMPPKISTAGFAGSFSQPPTESVGGKRKRSPGADVPDTPRMASSSTMHHRLGKPTRHIINAVVLTVLALGKICMHRENVPDVVHESDPHPQSHPSPVVKNGQPSSPGHGYSHTSPPESVATVSSGLPSPKEYDRPFSGRRLSVGDAQKARSARKNYDSIPGLEYMAIATDIIGNQLGGQLMYHVYANLFAGLFHGQLGRVIESHSYIAQACTTLMNILRPTMSHLYEILASGTPSRTPRENKLLYAFWSCLQLESDIVAEIPRHQSGLLAHEDNMPYPLMGDYEPPGPEDPDRHDKLNQKRYHESYLAQLYLRKRLNDIHRTFYSPHEPAANFREALRLDAGLANMGWCAPQFHFTDKDEPALDILSARLRAKFWGARVITHRPFIKMIVDFPYRLRDGQDTPPAHEFRGTLGGTIGAPSIKAGTTSEEDIDKDVVDLAIKGIGALIESTRAFHNLPPGRPIITNVFGTAHAQWGNLLVLAACYRNRVLRPYIAEDMLKYLLDRTIRFFDMVAVPTSALMIDKKILIGLRKDLFETPGSESAAHANTSFSSATSAADPSPLPPMMSGPIPPLGEPDRMVVTSNSGETMMGPPPINQEGPPGVVNVSF